MIKKLILILVTLIGAGIGLGIVGILDGFNVLANIMPSDKFGYLYILSGLIFGLIFLLFSRRIISGIRRVANELEKEIQNIPTGDILLGFVGLIMGLTVAFLLSGLLSGIPYAGFFLVLLVYVVLGYLGVRIFVRKKGDLVRFIEKTKKPKDKEKTAYMLDSKLKPKILDTSAIIDGRIYEICKAGFLEGYIVIPEFVLKELQMVSDSSDDLKRAKGRRGLDIIKKIQKELEIDVQVLDKDYENIPEVDIKLLKLAQDIGGKVVTTDYNLNKVAEVHGVEVLNINELSNAVKALAIPGEEMHVYVIKAGKEAGQGVAYLEDGTMIVVESGRPYVGKQLDLVVTSVLQTAAGRMIFGKPKELYLKEKN